MKQFFELWVARLALPIDQVGGLHLPESQRRSYILDKHRRQDISCTAFFRLLVNPIGID